MTTVTAKTKSGIFIHVPKFNKAFEEACEEGRMGLCIACGAEADGVEPDAHHYTCEVCGSAKVFGLEELMMRGLTK
jgi:hypothetical protein